VAELVSQPTSIQSVYSWFREDKIFVNRRYQRKLVWTLEEKQKLVESILKKYPVPAILIAERDGAPGTYEIIDGLQRLQAIMSFIETAFPTSAGTFFNIEFFPTAKAQADDGGFVPTDSDALLSQREVSTILDYMLAMSVMRNASEQEINDVFDRINTYGRRLSDQERRQSGVQNDFSSMVRELACALRGDASADVLPLKSMPSISIDLPMTKHGYEVKADEVFWVNQGILRATDLRDSMDEQCIADIAACIVGGELIERSKDALDEIYRSGSPESERIANALEVYGGDSFAEEFKFCVGEILKVCSIEKVEKLRDIIFKKRTTNAFPSVFATLLIAVHELIVKEGMKIADYIGVRHAINGLAERIETGRKATSIAERRRNVDQVRGLIGGCFVKTDVARHIYGNHASVDIESTIRRSEIELADYELKQGILTLADVREIDPGAIEKIIKTICAIANNGPQRTGKIIIGVTDKAADADRVKILDGVEPRKVGRRFVVGVAREAKYLNISLEGYFGKWRDAIKNSELSQPLKDSVLSSMDFNSFYGLGVLVITVPAQSEISYFGDDVYWRSGDTTEIADTPKKVATVARRF